MDILGSNVLEVHIVDLGADFHIVSHAWRCNDIPKGKRRIAFEFGIVIGFTFEFSPEGLVCSATVDFLDLLNDLEQSCSS